VLPPLVKVKQNANFFYKNSAQSALLNKQLLKALVINRQRDLEAYRFYIIARHHFYNRSGIFSLSELCDVLHAHYDFKTLHHLPGNNRTRFKLRLKAIFNDSMLFQTLQDGRYKVLGERRGFRYAQRTECPIEALKTSRAFIDRCICLLASGNGFKSHKQLAQQTGFSESRVRYAILRGQQAGYIEKTNNLIIVGSSETKTEINRQRGVLLAVHGIATPKPIYYKLHWHLAYYAPNNYKLVALGHKGTRSHLTFINDKCRFKMQDRLNDSTNLFLFNRAIYNADQYLADYGFKNV
jgi:hypothetical protein